MEPGEFTPYRASLTSCIGGDVFLSTYIENYNSFYLQWISRTPYFNIGNLSFANTMTSLQMEPKKLNFMYTRGRKEIQSIFLGIWILYIVDFTSMLFVINRNIYIWLLVSTSYSGFTCIEFKNQGRQIHLYIISRL